MGGMAISTRDIHSRLLSVLKRAEGCEALAGLLDKEGFVCISEILNIDVFEDVAALDIHSSATLDREELEENAHLDNSN